MTTTALQFTPQVFALPGVAVSDVASTLHQSTPPPTVTLTPNVTVDGLPTTSYTLSLLSPPTHGTAVVSGLGFQYTPAAGYYGADTFTYKATASGVDSNNATASLEILVPILARPIQKQHRLLADLYADTTLDCYCRSDAGPLDLTGYDLTAHVHPYNRPQPYGQDYGVGWPGIYVPYHTEFQATQLEAGHVQFTIDHGTLRQRLGSGLWKVNLVAVDPTSQARARVYTALLTIQ